MSDFDQPKGFSDFSLAMPVQVHKAPDARESQSAPYVKEQECRRPNAGSHGSRRLYELARWNGGRSARAGMVDSAAQPRKLAPDQEKLPPHKHLRVALGGSFALGLMATLVPGLMGTLVKTPRIADRQCAYRSPVVALLSADLRNRVALTCFPRSAAFKLRCFRPRWACVPAGTRADYRRVTIAPAILLRFDHSLLPVDGNTPV